MRVALANHYITRQANIRPDALAFQDDCGSFTYGQLESISNQVANALVQSGLLSGERACLCMKKSGRLLAALLGTLKANGIYVPLDAESPPERLGYICQDVGAKFLITDLEGLRAVGDMLGFCQYPVAILVITSSDIPSALLGAMPHCVGTIVTLKAFTDSHRECLRLDTDIAYIIYTSGSTGAPKGVAVSHRSIIDYAEWCVEHFRVSENDRLSSHAEFHFDLSVFDIYTALASGASLHAVSRDVSLFPGQFVDFVERSELTIWCSVPSFLTHIANLRALKRGRMPTLRVITFCGEAMPATTIAKWMEVYPKIFYVNQYGPTETTCASMYFDVTDVPVDKNEALPIGRPIPNTEVFLLDKDGHRIVGDEIGELCIRGSGNALGYWNSPARTALSFCQHDAGGGLYAGTYYKTGDLARIRDDGVFEFCGRVDSQIKYMGFRIEPGEIESVLGALPGVLEVAVVAQKWPKSAEISLVAFVVVEGPVERTTLETWLKRHLPPYMVPKKFIRLSRMPLSRNGKIDRKALISYEPKDHEAL